MKIVDSSHFASLSSSPKPLHIAIGMFDGIHLGHQSVIDSAIRCARLDNGLSAILTFFPHPSHVFQPKNPTPQIYPPAVKKAVLRRMHVDLYLEQKFDADFAQLDADAFVLSLKQRFPSLVSISVGENFRFGKGRSGDIRTLIQTAREQSVSVYSCERVQLDGSPISSTRLRERLPTLPIEQINHLLGHAYTSIGTVSTGRRMGRTLGFPTLNLPWEAEIQPMQGVYAVRIGKIGPHAKSMQNGIANFGLRPTVEKNQPLQPLLEVHVLDTTKLTYDDTLRVEWMQRIRPEEKFANTEALRTAIEKDLQTARNIFTNGRESSHPRYH